MPTSLRIHPRERRSVCLCTSRVQVLPAHPSPVPRPPPSPLLTDTDPLRVPRVHRRYERYHVLKLKPRRKRVAWPHVNPRRFSPLYLALFLSRSSEAEGKEEEKEENGGDSVGKCEGRQPGGRLCCRGAGREGDMEKGEDGRV